MKYILALIGLIIGGYSCEKSFPEYSYEGNIYVDTLMEKISPIKKVTAIPIFYSYPDSTRITANLISGDLINLGKIQFALDINLLPMTRNSDTEVSSAMTLGNYRGPGFYIEVQDIPAQYTVHLDLYAVIKGMYMYKKHIDYTNTLTSNTTDVAFEVIYTFK